MLICFLSDLQVIIKLVLESEKERDMDESSFSVLVEGGRPWGFTLQGGLEFRAPLRVGKVRLLYIAACISVLTGI